MRDHVHESPRLIYPVGTQVVVRDTACHVATALLSDPPTPKTDPEESAETDPENFAEQKTRNVEGLPTGVTSGAVGVVVKSPSDQEHAYRVRMGDGNEVSVRHEQLVALARFKLGDIVSGGLSPLDETLGKRVIFRCVVGSRAFGLDTDQSDTDRRGIYLPPAELHWSLYGVPEQLENEATQEAYWEARKFVVMALKANPNVLECLYSPLVETATPLAQELLAIKSVFLSRIVYQTFNGYVMSQFKKMQTDIRNQGRVKWKHVMHLIRLLRSGIIALREHHVPVHVGQYREELLTIRRGEMPWDEMERLRLSLHREFEQAFASTTLPEKPDYERANRWLIRARRLATHEELP